MDGIKLRTNQVMVAMVLELTRLTLGGFLEMMRRIAMIGRNAFG